MAPSRSCCSFASHPVPVLCSIHHPCLHHTHTHHHTTLHKCTAESDCTSGLSTTATAATATLRHVLYVHCTLILLLVCRIAQTVPVLLSGLISTPSRHAVSCMVPTYVTCKCSLCHQPYLRGDLPRLQGIIHWGLCLAVAAGGLFVSTTTALSPMTARPEQRPALPRHHRIRISTICKSTQSDRAHSV